MTNLVDAPRVRSLTGHLEDGLSRLEAAYPEVHRYIERGAQAIETAEVSHDFQGIGISCRDAFINFADQIFSPDFSDGGENIEQNKTNDRIEITLRHYGKSRATKGLRRRAKDIQARAQALQHNRDASREAASWVLFHSAAALIELGDIIEAATARSPLKRRYGHVICPECHTTDLYEEFIGSAEKGTNVLGCNTPTCFYLGWPKDLWHLPGD